MVTLTSMHRVLPELSKEAPLLHSLRDATELNGGGVPGNTTHLRRV